MTFKFTRTALRRKVPKSCPDRREHVKEAPRLGVAPTDCRHAGVLHDPSIPHWYASPKPKHSKIMPRWYGMLDGTNGRVKTRKATDEELSGDIVPEFDYRSKGITWGPRLPSSLV